MNEPNTLKRILVAGGLCILCAVPSFFIARANGFDVYGMLVGVGGFSIAFVAVACSPAFRRALDKPFVRSTVKIGYGFRAVITVLYPFGMFADMLTGIVSIDLARVLVGDAKSFIGTILTTLTQGTLMNLLVLFLMLIVYTAQWCFRKPPEVDKTMCQACGYDLRASPDRCPECGEPRLPSTDSGHAMPS